MAEPGHVFSWLIAGSERSVLLDTGLGLADIAAAIAPVALTPTIVVNSHVHFDHVGGNELFEHTEMHERSPEWMEYGSREQELQSYRELAEDVAESWGRLEQADRAGWFMIGPDETLRRSASNASPHRTQEVAGSSPASSIQSQCDLTAESAPPLQVRHR
jgi:glyoxylase-like metal-dependent hydrolase (beta-lactamase superfamily II)